MHQTAAHMQNFTPMKKKICAALVVVIVGHAGVLWSLSQLKTPEINKIEKEPLKIRLVNIKEKPPEPPKPKVEPPKPATPPKEIKEVKVVDKPLPPPPPKKVEKVQQVKKTEVAKPVEKAVEAKPTPTPVVTAKPMLSEKPAPVAAPVVAAPTPAPPAPAAPVAPPAPAAPPAPPAAKSVSIGGAGVQWSRSPKPSYSNKDLDGATRRIVVLIEADEKGVIKVARITQSSGIAALDEKILRTVRSAKFKPYKENGIAYPIRAQQPFELTLNPNG